MATTLRVNDIASPVYSQGANSNLSIETTRQLLQLQSIQYIRPNLIRVDVTNARPNTKLNLFFDGVSIGQYCTPSVVESTTLVAQLGKVKGDPIITDSFGRCTFSFDIPGGVFNTGKRELVVTDAPDMDTLNVIGSSFGSASAEYATNGVLGTFQVTRTEVSRRIITVMPPTDPLAQSFFTQGVKGGFFLTSIGLYFQTKDTEVPIRVEIRKMALGLPMALDTSNPDLVSTLTPADVITNTTAQVKAGTAQETRFRFDPPVYLEEDADYCFVVLANSVKYNLYTAEMGQKSLETDRTILEQPFGGSMFKSENNHTWTPEQWQDIKFNIYKAEFQTSTGTPKFVGKAPTSAVRGTSFFTTSGSPRVVYRAKFKHALEIGDLISIGASSAGTYNGIPGASFTGAFPVTEVIDEYTVAFTVSAAATATGKINSSGYVSSIYVASGGSGYSSGTTLTVSAPPSGTTATATPIIQNGVIIRVDVSGGSGYVNAPTVSITGVGSGAELIPSIDAIFSVTTNAEYSIVSPKIDWGVTSSSELTATVKNMIGNYPGGSLTSYTFGADANLPVGKAIALPNNARLANRNNEYLRISNQNSLELQLGLSSSNPNVSPIIDLRSPPKLYLGTFSINDQGFTEDLNSTDSSGSIASPIVNFTGGNGYGSSTPTITVIPADSDTTGSGAVLTPVMVGGSVSSITVTNPGSGYTKPPTIVISAPTSGVQATAQVDLTPFNSERNTIGTAFSRYITKTFSLQTVSSDIKLYASIDSGPDTTVDVYVRTSLSAANAKHEDQLWTILKCDVARNKSGAKGQYFQYEFYSAGLGKFDTYDLKFVFSSKTPTKTPYVKNYRAIVMV